MVKKRKKPLRPQPPESAHVMGIETAIDVASRFGFRDLGGVRDPATGTVWVESLLTPQRIKLVQQKMRRYRMDIMLLELPHWDDDEQDEICTVEMVLRSPDNNTNVWPSEWRAIISSERGPLAFWYSGFLTWQMARESVANPEELKVLSREPMEFVDQNLPEEDRVVIPVVFLELQHLVVNGAGLVEEWVVGWTDVNGVETFYKADKWRAMTEQDLLGTNYGMNRVVPFMRLQ
jgi:hypothetical protein